MHTTLKTKLIQHLLKKKQEGGFTLIELLVVIIIIGILAAIALPSFLNQANKARQAEAVTYVGSINRSQQSYFTENNDFSDTIAKLGLGIQTQTENYRYGNGNNAEADENLTVSTAAAGNVAAGGAFAVNSLSVSIFAYPQQIALRSFSGVTYLAEVQAAGAGTDEATTTAVVCESENAIGPGLAQENLVIPILAVADGFVTEVTSDNGDCGED